MNIARKNLSLSLTLFLWGATDWRSQAVASVPSSTLTELCVTLVHLRLELRRSNSAPLAALDLMKLRVGYLLSEDHFSMLTLDLHGVRIVDARDNGGRRALQHMLSMMPMNTERSSLSVRYKMKPGTSERTKDKNN
jgi:hypothetical protein